MAIKDVEAAILQCRKALDNSLVHNETNARYSVIDPIIWALGWKTHIPRECLVEHQLGPGDKVDYALFDRNGECVILIEAKRANQNLTNQYERQLARYARRVERGVGVLANGKEWRLYDLSVKGRFEGKRFATVKIHEDNVRSAAQTLYNALSKRKWWTGRVTRPKAPEEITFATFHRVDEEPPVQIWIDWEKPESETLIEEYQIQFRTKGNRRWEPGRWANVEDQPVDRRTKNFYCPGRAIADPKNKIEMRIRAKNSIGWSPWSTLVQETPL